MKKLIIGVLILIAAVLIFIVIKGKQSAYGKAEAKAAMSQKFIEMDSNGDGLVSKEEFDAAAQKEIADKKVDTPEKLEKFNKFMAYTWENGDVNHDNICLPKNLRHKDKETAKNFPEKNNKKPLLRGFLFMLSTAMNTAES